MQEDKRLKCANQLREKSEMRCWGATKTNVPELPKLMIG